ncbi:importin subunit beta-3 [Tritrichomonas musculus]|uniref:Importin subunit beta-3 n=1 Tax=Tritrichomonas musculus TaxID=1915356 RepID=A0ABR2K7S7_9EUKA
MDDLQSFQNLLLNTLDIDEQTRNQAENTLLNFKNSNYECYIDYEINSIINPINERIPRISITHLYREAKSGQLFDNEEITKKFASNFTSNITNQLLSPNIEDQFKINLSSILAILHVHIYKIYQDITIPKYILNAYLNFPQVKKYLMSCVYEIAIVDPDLGGFSLNDIIKILCDDLSDQNLFVQRLHLYFALVKNKPDLQIFDSLFEPLIIAPMDNLEFGFHILKSIANFSDINSYFFFPYVITLFGKLIRISLNADLPDQFRNLALICISSIVKNAPKMCKSIPDFYQNFIARLVLIVSEIKDGEINDDLWEYNPNDDRPCMQALDTINSIDDSLRSEVGFRIIAQIYQPILQLSVELDPNSPLSTCFKYGADSWQAKYAVISSLSEIMNPYCDFNSIASFLDIIIPLLNLQVHLPIRISIYRYIKSACSRLIIIDGIGKDIDIVFQIAFKENTSITKQCAFRVLVAFFSDSIVQHCSKVNGKLIIDQLFNRYYELLINEIQNQPFEISKYIIMCIGYMAKAYKKNFLKYFMMTATTLSSLLQLSPDLSVSIKIIYSFANSLEYVSIGKQPDLKAICAQFLQLAIHLFSNDTTSEEEADELVQSISTFLCKLKGDGFQFVNEAIPRVLLLANKSINIERVDTFESIFGLSSLYIQIPSPDNTLKQYAIRNDVIDVKQALQILFVIIRSSENSLQYIDQITQIAKHWICSEFFIEDVVFYSWEVLKSLLEYSKENLYFIEFCLQAYIESMDNYGSLIFLSKILHNISKFLRSAEKIKWSNQEMFVKLLVGLPKLVSYVISVKLEYSNTMHKFNNYDYQDKKLNDINVLMAIVNDYISCYYEISMDVSFEFLKDNIIPMIFQSIDNYELMNFSVEFIYNLYFYKQPEIDAVIQFSDKIIENILKLTPDIAKENTVQFLHEILGNIYYNFKLQNKVEYVDKLVNFYYHYITYDIDGENPVEYDETSDYANVALSKILLNNLDVMSNPVNAVDLWDRCKPLWYAVKDSCFYFAFMVNLIYQKSFLQELDIYWIDSYLLAILKDYNVEKIGKENLIQISKLLSMEMETEKGIETVQNILDNNDDIKENFDDLLGFASSQKE